jgi:hypothetical protein
MLLLYRQNHPATALILAGDEYVLTFRRASSTSSTSPQVELSFDPISDFDVLGCSLLCQVYSSLGLVQLLASSATGTSNSKDIFLAVIVNAQSLTSRYNPQEQVHRIQNVEFFSVSNTAWDDWSVAGGAPSAAAAIWYIVKRHR